VTHAWAARKNAAPNTHQALPQPYRGAAMTEAGLFLRQFAVDQLVAPPLPVLSGHVDPAGRYVVGHAVC
jgi:hypothetical protein